MTAEQPTEQWWLCCWGHIFSHAPVADSDQLSCPCPDGDEGPCGTSFIYAPFDTAQAARANLANNGPTMSGTPWARWVQ